MTPTIRELGQLIRQAPDELTAHLVTWSKDLELRNRSGEFGKWPWQKHYGLWPWQRRRTSTDLSAALAASAKSTDRTTAALSQFAGTMAAASIGEFIRKGAQPPRQ